MAPRKRDTTDTTVRMVSHEARSGEDKYLLKFVALAVTALLGAAPSWWLKSQQGELEAKLMTHIESVKTAQLVSRQEIENNLLKGSIAAKDDTNGRIEAMRKEVSTGLDGINTKLSDLKERLKVVEVGNGKGR